MLARIARATLKSNRCFTNTRPGLMAAKKPVSAKEEIEILDPLTPEIKDAIKQSKKQFQSVIKNLTSTEGKPIQITGFKPTIQITTASGKIAHAIFDAAATMRSVGIVAKDFQLVADIIESTPSFKDLLESDISNNEKITMLELLSNATGLSPISSFFVYFMTYEHNFGLILPAIKDFKRLVGSLDTEMSIRLTVAKEQNGEEKASLEKTVKSFFPPETQFKFNYVVDPSIQKGYIIESPFLTHDASFANAVKKVGEEENMIISELIGDIKKGIKSQTLVWETKEFREKYLTFDEKAYNAKLE
ncbi:hypothetical protein DICPUDRAFT_97908 [Dictyostelium purpureum]|uniref:Uncharacterized protein n=1 Tax=Dictyostelium purpureum TaxID=5786 RepID=F0ZKW7_DICPU|nr:uncharacterized protein DICPUDRAFT_97908 [Dictyostelium purpureum]EGC35448.1 hypothetical protein DICPUDRAFT_97908 [Dictyostelium purpureum]|eukprot:XP_003288061.1 hypothetical protein DICPUDRAFT_97908 [Dictyostelium purpureum]